jgi:hypothetical protein
VFNRTKLFQTVPHNSICAEIGVWRGRNAREILINTKPKKLYLIDPWIWDQGSLPKDCYLPKRIKWFGHGGMDGVYKLVVEKFASDENVEIIREKSVEAARKFEDESLDWIYVDGAHDYPNVIADLNAWSKKVKVNGFITGDDWDWGGAKYGHTIRKAIYEFIEDGSYTLVETGGNQFILRRVK